MRLTETLETYPAWQRYSIFSGLVIILVFAFYYMKYSPAQTEIVAHDGKIADLDEQINKGLAMKERLVEFRKEVFQLKEKMRLAADVLGNRPNVDLLVKSMETLASQSGLKVERFQPLPERKAGFYGEIPISLKVKGGYHELGFFFDKIANETRIMNVSDSQITAFRAGKYTIDAVCILTAFWYMAEDNPPPPPPPPPQKSP